MPVSRFDPFVPEVFVTREYAEMTPEEPDAL